MTMILFLMVLVGMVFLAASLPSISSILRSLGSGQLFRGWQFLRVLILIFLAGYACFGVLLFQLQTTTSELIVSPILMAGGGFVLVVARLSHLTTKDILRITALEREVMRDALTGAFNRRYLDAKLDEEIRRAHRPNRPLSTLMLDLDHFKHINDTYGHPVGDQVIQHVCRLISSELRVTDTIIRYGGEEFVVVAPDSDIEAASALGNRLLHHICARTLDLPDGKTITVTVSIGVAQFKLGETAERLLSRADEALYAAKRNGRNRLEVVDNRQAMQAIKVP